jgi:hypothetical protein
MKELKELLEINPNIENVWVNKDNTVWHLFEPFIEKLVNDEIVQECLEGFKKLTRKEILKYGIK